MSVKQDRQGARTPAELDRRYNLGSIKGEYAKTSDLEGYAKKTDLNKYATTSALASFVSETEFADTVFDINAGLSSTTRIANEAASTANGVASDVNDHLEFADGGTRIKGSFNALFLPKDTDLDGVTLPNKYTGGDASDYAYLNCPIESGSFSLVVEACGEEGQLLQRLTHCHKTECRIYERFYYSESWGAWQCIFDATRKGISTDSGWLPLTVDSAFIVRNNDESLKPVYKVTGNVVTVCGAVSNVAEMTSTSSGVVFASGIPEEYRPHIDHHFVCQGSGMNRWVCSVKTDGTLVLSRYGTTAQGTIAANAWLSFSCTYQF